MQVAFHLMHRQVDSKNRLKIGTYRTVEAARHAISQLKNLAGFRDSKESFSIRKCILNQEYIPQGLDVQAEIAKHLELDFLSEDINVIFFVFNEPNPSEVHPDDTAILIGYYSNETLAQNAIERIRKLAIFPEHGREFNYCATPLNQTGWTNGYTTIEETMKQFR